MNLEIPGTIIISALAGSHAYGLATEQSDEDYRGVFVTDKKLFYKQEFPLELSDQSNDQSYFEITKFSELLLKSNPSILEMMHYPEENIREIHPAFELYKNENWLSKKCRDSFMGYALSQLRKAYDLKKRINLPENDRELTGADFLDVYVNAEVLRFSDFSDSTENFSVYPLVEEMNMYSLWKNPGSELSFNADNEFSEFKKGTELVGYLRFKKSEFGKYRREYASYFKWKSDTEKQGKAIKGGEYDGKYMMHALRLLFTAKDIAEKGELILVRPEREFLLKVRNHEFEYGELLNQTEDLVHDVKQAFNRSDLPISVDQQKAKNISAEIRTLIYEG